MRLGELPEPVPRGGEVRVAVHASSINPVDYKIRNGALSAIPGTRRFPRPFGMDFAGVVEQPGEGVTEFASGDRVYGTVITQLGRPGAHAELVRAPAKRLRRMPGAMDFVSAAALPVAGLTALRAVRMAGSRALGRVLVTGATGGVGHFAVQIARAGGATVTALCSAANAARARQLGAQHVLDYRTVRLDALPDRFDLIVDAHGGLGWAGGARLLARGGAYANPWPTFWLTTRGLWSNLLPIRRGYVANFRGRPDDYAELEGLVAAGQVKPVVEHLFPLERAAEAFALAERGRFVGKIVLMVR